MKMAWFRAIAGSAGTFFNVWKGFALLAKERKR